MCIGGPRMYITRVAAGSKVMHIAYQTALTCQQHGRRSPGSGGTGGGAEAMVTGCTTRLCRPLCPSPIRRHQGLGRIRFNGMILHSETQVVGVGDSAGLPKTVCTAHPPRGAGMGLEGGEGLGQVRPPPTGLRGGAPPSDGCRPFSYIPAMEAERGMHPTRSSPCLCQCPIANGQSGHYSGICRVPLQKHGLPFPASVSTTGSTTCLSQPQHPKGQNR